MKSNARLFLIYAVAAVFLVAILLVFPSLYARTGLLGLGVLGLALWIVGLITAAAVHRFVVRPAQQEVEDTLRRSQEELELRVAERTRELRRNAERLGILHEIDQSVLAAQQPELIALAAIGRIRRLVPCQRALVTAVDKDGQARVLALQASGDLTADVDTRDRWPALYGELLAEIQDRLPGLAPGSIYGADDVEVMARRSNLQQALHEVGIRAYIVVPLLLQDELLGTLHLESATARRFTATHVTVAREVGTSLAVAIHQARLHSRVQQELQERMEAEASLQRRTVALEARNAELDAFAHTVAHDLKNPLAAVYGYTDLLQKRRQQMSDEALDHYLEILARNVLKMNTIVEELLLLSSVRAREDIETGPVEMGPIVAEAQARLQYLLDELEGEIQMPRRWPVALGYGPWIEEVWTNYISNALKYGGRPPHVELGFDPPDLRARSGERTVKYWVRDDGPGLTAEDRAALFTPFERLHQIRAEGHGLGLSIVRRIIHKLGGQVGVESSGQQGEGATFYFTLPAYEDGQEHAYRLGD